MLPMLLIHSIFERKQIFGFLFFAWIGVFDIMQISLLIDAARYFIVVITVGYLCPILFKKIKL
jgi:hypothetical protein